MQHDNIPLIAAHSIQRFFQLIQGVKIADRDEYVSGLTAHALWREFLSKQKIELVHVRVSGAAFASNLLRDFKDYEEDDGERHTRESCNLLRKYVDDAKRDERQ